MAFTVQDDFGTVDGANSYISVDDFRSYHADRGRDLSSYPTALVEQAIIRATDYVDGRFRYVGERRTEDQRTAWPRTNAVDVDGDTRTGLPAEVVEACAEYAYAALSSDLDPTPTRDTSGRAVQSYRKKVGPLEKGVTYADGARYEHPRYPVADRKLLKTGLVVAPGELGRA